MLASRRECGNTVLGIFDHVLTDRCLGAVFRPLSTPGANNFCHYLKSQAQAGDLVLNDVDALGRHDQ